MNLGCVMCWCSYEVTMKAYVVNVYECWIRHHCEVFLKTCFFFLYSDLTIVTSLLLRAGEGLFDPASTSFVMSTIFL